MELHTVRQLHPSHRTTKSLDGGAVAEEAAVIVPFALVGCCAGGSGSSSNRSHIAVTLLLVNLTVAVL